jgi:hypothetical protein
MGACFSGHKLSKIFYGDRVVIPQPKLTLLMNDLVTYSVLIHLSCHNESDGWLTVNRQEATNNERIDECCRN